MNTPIRIVVIEDSEVMLRSLVRLYDEDEDLQVVAAVRTGAEGISAVFRLKPDLISLDMMLPDMDGFEVVTRVMADQPTPIFVLTASLSPKWRKDAFHALSLGAIDVMEKPRGKTFHDAAWRKQVHQKLKFIAKMPVIPHVLSKIRKRRERAVRTVHAPAETHITHVPSGVMPGFIGIVGSAGSPKALTSIFGLLREGFPLPAPIVVAIHLGPNMQHGFARLLAEVIGIPAVYEVSDGMQLEPGCIYVAPGGQHIGLTSKYQAQILDHLEGAGYKPSLDYFLWTVARTWGLAGVGIVLSGMGTDGAEGLMEIRKSGGRTLAQDKDSCVVNGMPGRADQSGAALQVLSPVRIAETVLAWFRNRT